MQIQLSAPTIWLANEPVDFRKAVNGLSELVKKDWGCSLSDQVFVFYNRRRDKLKLLGYHRHGAVLIYKRLDKKKFTVKRDGTGRSQVSEKQLAWLLAGLDWVTMSDSEELDFDDFY